MIIVLIILHLVGVVSLWWEVHPDFILLTPVNLLVTFGLVLANHRKPGLRLVAILLLAFLVGYAVELAGVNFGMLFGEYAYGPVLGPQYHGTPWMIGFNWAMLLYCSGVLANALLPGRHWGWRALLGAVLMTGLDFLIEPVAVHYNFWRWAETDIPLSNYGGWLLVSLALHALFQQLLPDVRNKAGVALFILQMLFFFILGFK